MKEKILFLVLIIFPNFAFSQTDFPGYDIIGKGYNIFGEFANNKSIEQYNIFDFSKMKRKKEIKGFDIPQVISIDNISSHTIKIIEGNSIKEYISNLSNKVGLSANFFIFKASFNRQFEIKSNYDSKTFYYTYMDINTKWRISLDTRNIDTLINYLDPQFKNDLKNLRPDILFDRYGTHFIARAYLGGRIDYSSVSRLTSNISKEKLKKAINAKINKSKSFNANSDITNLNLDESILKQTETTINLNIIGGNSEYTNDIENKIQYREWAEGIKKFPVLSNFDNRSLVPIWTLTNDIIRKNELKKYFENSILPKYPIPFFYKTDPVLDNEKIEKTFNIRINGFYINKDCDNGNNLLGNDESGDFIYNINIFANDDLVKNIRNNNITHIWSGNFLNINNNVKVKLPIYKTSTIKITWKLVEFDQYSDNELVGKGEKLFTSPFTPKVLYNYKDNKTNYWTEKLYHSDNCNANLFFQIFPDYNKTAIEFGNNGWNEYLKGNYDKALSYSKNALERDNSLWFVQYNIALIYLIKQNPNAYQKYKTITEICDDTKAIKGALNDIEQYERNNGKIKNSERIKILLKSKIKY